MATNTRDRPIRLLLIDDDPDDFLLTKEVVAEMSGEFTPSIGSRTTKLESKPSARANTTFS